MVEVKVIKAFRDKENDLQLRAVDEIFQCQEERAEQLIEAGFVEQAEPEQAEPEQEEPKKKRATKAQ